MSDDAMSITGWMAAARIGRGGGGPDPCVPECPVCGAYGGGGHGGFCPNGDKRSEEWVSEVPGEPR